MTIHDDSLWVLASYDHEEAETEALLSTAAVESAGLMGFVMAAETEADFHNRVALADNGLRATAAALTPEGSPGYFAVIAALPERWYESWQNLFEARQAATQASNAPRAAQRAQERKRASAWEDSQVNFTSDDEGYLVDTDMNPLRRSDFGDSAMVSFVWSRDEANRYIGQVPEFGPGYPAKEFMPATAYKVMWAARHGQEARYHLFPRSASRKEASISNVRTWANGYGNWNAAVEVTGVGSESEAEAAALSAIREELALREGPGFAPEVVGVRLHHKDSKDGTLTLYYEETNSNEAAYSEVYGSRTAEINAPYRIKESGGKYLVVNDNGDTKGTHDSYDKAREQQKALYASVPGAREMAEEKSSKAASRKVAFRNDEADCKNCGRVIVALGPNQWVHVDDDDAFCQGDKQYDDPGSVQVATPQPGTLRDMTGVGQAASRKVAAWPWERTAGYGDPYYNDDDIEMAHLNNGYYDEEPACPSCGAQDSFISASHNPEWQAKIDAAKAAHGGPVTFCVKCQGVFANTAAMTQLARRRTAQGNGNLLNAGGVGNVLVVTDDTVNPFDADSGRIEGEERKKALENFRDGNPTPGVAFWAERGSAGAFKISDPTQIRWDTMASRRAASTPRDTRTEPLCKKCRGTGSDRWGDECYSCEGFGSKPSKEGSRRTAAISVRPASYRGEEGFQVSGKDRNGSSVKIFTKTEAGARKIQEAYQTLDDRGAIQAVTSEVLRSGASRRTASDDNSWPTKQDGEEAGSDAPPAAPGAPGDQPTPDVPPAAQQPGVAAESVSQGDVLLDAADGVVSSYQVNGVTDQGDSVLLSVTKDGAEDMDLLIPKADQVQVLPSAGGSSEPAVEPTKSEDPAPEGDDPEDEDDEKDDTKDEKDENPFAKKSHRKTSVLFYYDEHAANPPESWVAVKAADRVWQLQTKDGGVLGSSYPSKAAAEADKTSGPLVRQYHDDAAYYASEKGKETIEWQRSQRKASRRRKPSPAQVGKAVAAAMEHLAYGDYGEGGYGDGAYDENYDDYTDDVLPVAEEPVMDPVMDPEVAGENPPVSSEVPA